MSSQGGYVKYFVMLFLGGFIQVQTSETDHAGFSFFFFFFFVVVVSF